MARKLMMNNVGYNELTPVVDGLIGWYDAKSRTNDNSYLIDKSDNGNNLNCVDLKGNSVCFNDYIEIKGSSFSQEFDYSNHLSGEFTVMYYINTTISDTVNRLKCMSGNYLNNLGWWVRIGSTQSNVWYLNKKYIDDNNSTAQFPKDKIMVALVFNQFKSKMYLNGVLIVDKDSQNVLVQKLTIGVLGHSSYENSTPYRYYSSYVYNRALTQEEIQQNHLYEKSIKRGD